MKISTRSTALFWAKVNVRGLNDCWPWTAATTGGGYGVVRIDRMQRQAHRISFELARGYKPKEHVRHKCDHRACCNPLHLEEGSQADNMRDMTERRRGTAILSDTEVRYIRASYETHPYMAAKFGVSIGVIERVRAGTTYKHVR